MLSIKGLEEHCRRLGEEELISLSSGEKKEMRNTLKVSELRLEESIEVLNGISLRL